MSPRKTLPTTNVEAQLPPELWQLYSVLVDAGAGGMTYEELSAIIGRSKAIISNRVWELRKLNRVEQSGRRTTPRGAQAPVWIAVGSR